jgi:hypothetical protein
MGEEEVLPGGGRGMKDRKGKESRGSDTGNPS